MGNGADLDSIAIAATLPCHILFSNSAHDTNSQARTKHYRLVVQRRMKGTVKYPSVLGAFQMIYNEEGLGGLWAGWDSALAMGAINAVMSSVCCRIIIT